MNTFLFISFFTLCLAGIYILVKLNKNRRQLVIEIDEIIIDTNNIKEALTEPLDNVSTVRGVLKKQSSVLEDPEVISTEGDKPQENTGTPDKIKLDDPEQTLIKSIEYLFENQRRFVVDMIQNYLEEVLVTHFENKNHQSPKDNSSKLAEENETINSSNLIEMEITADLQKDLLDPAASQGQVDSDVLTLEADELKRKALERIAKLRNLSFNLYAADPNNESESVPAYLRRNMELQSSLADVESFYSNYTVKSDKNNQAEISTINTFLDGKKPD